MSRIVQNIPSCATTRRKMTIRPVFTIKVAKVPFPLLAPKEPYPSAATYYTRKPELETKLGKFAFQSLTKNNSLKEISELKKLSCVQVSRQSV